MTDQAPPTVEGLQRQVLQLQIEAIKTDIKDHETRLRTVEETATRFNFMLYLTMGGGLLSLVNLIGTLAVIGLYLSNGKP